MRRRTDQDEKRVAIVRCDDYRRERVSAAVRSAVDLIGGIDRFVAPGDTVLLKPKPNLLQGSEPDACVTTHPEVVYAVADLIGEQGSGW
ncbi:hypothetical protein [Methanoculleus sp.]|uniref:hypothetical protein n=1 Tax=Methanoculleus sp. TaxID=90427 RepID=UPI00272EC4BF|nr:hypothetical protein [Methanoculleus sp.]